MTPHPFAEVLHDLADGVPVDEYRVRLRSWEPNAYMPLKNHLWTFFALPGEIAEVSRVSQPVAESEPSRLLVNYATLQRRLQEETGKVLTVGQIRHLMTAGQLVLHQDSPTTAGYYYSGTCVREGGTTVVRNLLLLQVTLEPLG